MGPKADLGDLRRLLGFSVHAASKKAHIIFSQAQTLSETLATWRGSLEMAPRICGAFQAFRRDNRSGCRPNLRWTFGSGRLSAI